MIQRDDPPLVLASASTARLALLKAAGLRVEAVPAAVDEAALKEAAQAEGATAEETALLLADAKARRVAQRWPESLVIGCDQLLVCEGRWFDKPEGMPGARAHLEALRGRIHILATAVVAWRSGGRIWHHVATPTLSMRPFSDAFLDAYLAAEGEMLLSSVGAYRLEGLGVHLFDRVEGEHAAILGLPLLPLLGFMRQHGVVAS